MVKESAPKEIQDQNSWRVRFSHVVWEFLNPVQDPASNHAAENGEVEVENRKEYAQRKIIDARDIIIGKMSVLKENMDDSGNFFDPADKKVFDEYEYSLAFLEELSNQVLRFKK